MDRFLGGDGIWKGFSQTEPVLFVYVVGASSSGKTTLCNALAAELSIGAYVKEVARTVMQEQGFSWDDVGSGGKIEMQKAIMKAQIQAEKDAKTRAQPKGWIQSFGLGGKRPREVVLCDRSAIDPLVYADWCVSTPEDKDRVRKEMESVEGFGEILKRAKSSLVVLLEPVEEWVVDDGVRTVGSHWRFFNELATQLQAYGVQARRIGEEVRGLDERVRMVKGWIDERR